MTGLLHRGSRVTASLYKHELKPRSKKTSQRPLLSICERKFALMLQIETIRSIPSIADW